MSAESYEHASPSPLAPRGAAKPVLVEPEAIRVQMRVELVPKLVLEPCICGNARHTYDARTIEAVMTNPNAEVADMCTCGRRVVGYVPKIVEAGL